MSAEQASADSSARAQLDRPRRPAVDAGADWLGDKPDRLGPYRVVRPLGRGGMGVVYLAEQLEPVQREVALKVIRLDVDRPDVLTRFDAERHVLALMHHPNIATVHDAGVTPEGRPYIVMEHVDGAPITEHCNQRRLSIEQRLRLFLLVCDAVQHAHQKGVVHRDIKPSNILVLQDELRSIPKVIDFGIAKMLAVGSKSRHNITLDGQVLGTVGYMAPEQAEGEVEMVDTRTDVYSLGTILYELLVGASPHEPVLAANVPLHLALRWIHEEDPKRPSTRVRRDSESARTICRDRRVPRLDLVRQLRGDLDWIVMKSLAKDRRRRYATVSEFAADISRYLAGHPVEARPHTLRYIFSKFARRHRAIVAGASVAVIAICAGLAGTTWGMVRAARQQARAEGALLAEAAAAAEARRQAGVASEVSRFLIQDLLAAPQADRKGRQVTVREVLDDAVAALDGRFEHEPLIEAGIRGALGNSYASLGEYPTAEAQLVQAIERLESHEPTDARTITRAKSDLAGVLLLQGRWEESEKLFREVLATRREVLGELDPDALLALNNMVGGLHAQGKYDAAIAFAEAALAASEKINGQDHPDTLLIASNLAANRVELGQYAEAAETLAEVLALQRGRLSPDHSETMQTAHNLATALFRAGELDRAEALFRDTLERRQRAFDHRHIKTIETTVNLAELLRSRGKLEEVQRMYRDLLDALLASPGERNSVTLVIMNNLAQAHIDAKQFKDAEPLCRRAVEIGRQILPANHPYYAAFLGVYGACLQGLGRLDEAETTLQEAYEMLKAARGASHDDTRKVADRLAQLYEQLGKPEPAVEWRTRARP